jgi:hypothetical protein
MAKTHCLGATKLMHKEIFLPHTYHHHGLHKKYAQPYWKQDFYFTHARTVIYVLFSQGCAKWGNGRLDKVGKDQTMVETR